MAYVKMKPIKKTVKKAIDYILDPAKMGDVTLAFSHHVNKELAALEFSLIRDACLSSRPNKQKIGNENLAYHIVQSHLKSDRVTPVMALEIAKKTIKDYTQDYAYVIAVHTDKAHLHAHIIMNAYSHTGKKKLNNYRSVEKLLEISNKHCLEHGLSTSQIKKKQPEHVKGKQLYQDYKKKPSGREKLKHLIDEMIDISKDFDEFIDNIQKAGIEVRHRGGLSFLLPDAKRPIRISSLKDSNYDTVEALQNRIEDKVVGTSSVKKETKKIKISQIEIVRKQTWINYYSRNYWRRKSDNLEAISLIARMLSHMREHDIKEIADYDVVINDVRKDIKAIKNQVTKLESQYDELEATYKNSSVDKQTEIGERLKAIRAEIQPLNHQVTSVVKKQAELEKFKAMFEKERSQSRKKKHEKGLSI